MIPLASQREKLHRLLDERATHYRRAVDKGRLALDVAAAKHAELLAIRRTFDWLIANHDWIRAEAQRRQVEARKSAEIEAHPAVAAVLTAFPEAVVTAVRQPVVTDLREPRP